MDLLLAGMDQSQADQLSSLAEGLPFNIIQINLTSGKACKQGGQFIFLTFPSQQDSWAWARSSPSEDH
eukprot:1159122-Pelagomonas_calceolata.AAC.17